QIYGWRAGEGEPEGLRPAHPDIQTLDRVTRAALHEVVQCRDGHQPAGVLIAGVPDVAEFRSHQDFRLRVPVFAPLLRDQPDERLVVILLPERPTYGRPVDAGSGGDVTDGLHATHRLDPGRGHGDRNPDVSGDLSLVPVPGRREHPHRPTAFGVQVRLA